MPIKSSERRFSHWRTGGSLANMSTTRREGDTKVLFGRLCQDIRGFHHLLTGYTKPSTRPSRTSLCLGKQSRATSAYRSSRAGSTRDLRRTSCGTQLVSRRSTSGCWVRSTVSAYHLVYSSIFPYPSFPTPGSTVRRYFSFPCQPISAQSYDTPHFLKLKSPL